MQPLCCAHAQVRDIEVINTELILADLEVNTRAHPHIPAHSR